MQIRIKFLLALVIISTLAFVMFTYSAEDSNLRRINHETYSSGESNYEFCMKLCVEKGGINCGGKRKGCCKQTHCKANKIYGFDECDKGESQKLGTDRCIGSWN